MDFISNKISSNGLMPDIAMCNDDSCPMKKTCYRFVAVPNEFRQSYFTESPRKGDDCEYFERIDGRWIMSNKENHRKV